MFGCAPDQVLKLRILAGDSSDGIPNVVPKLGPVKALKYLTAGLDPLALAPNMVTDLPWETVRRNARLMTIVTSAGSSEIRAYGKPGTDLIKLRCREAEVNAYQQPCIRARELIQVLAPLELQEAIENRHDLLAVQD